MYMKRIALALIMIGCVLITNAQEKPKLSIIPEPVSMTTGEGAFEITSATAIEVNGNDSIKRIANDFAAKLSTASGLKVPVSGKQNSSAATNKILFTSSTDKTLGTEGYTLTVTPALVTIASNNAAGAFYAVQTLYQMLPKEINSKAAVTTVKWMIPAATITDYPRFGWRGLMFDVSRHFFTKEQVKQFIDQMVPYKYNLLHLTLANDEGWRIEIKSLPKLTEVGAWRPKREGRWANMLNPDPNDPHDYGGFYTQDDIRELVKYAGDRFVNILPEIDVPGHSLAAVASYPELSCTPGPHPVYEGKPFMDWPGPVALIDNTLCPANENVYVFLDKVFTEIAGLFPFRYIHMGGDECPKNFWAKSDAIKALMKKEGLKDQHEVQSYFSKRVEKIITAKKKKVIGWDEILEGGLAPSAAVMSWRGEKGGIEAAKMQHEVVMSPTTYVYLDYMQSDELLEAHVYASLRLNKTYQFEPVPPGVDAKYVLGGQANLWTEQIGNMRYLQYMVWPRALAVAESVWSPKDKKNWPDFIDKVENNFDRMDVAEIKYSRGMYDAIVTAKKEDGKLVAVIDKEIPDLDVYYSLDESTPDKFYPKYEKPFPLPPDVATLKVITYRNGKVAGRQINIPVKELEKRVTK